MMKFQSKHVDRTISTTLSVRLGESAAVALLGTRQVGKTTLAQNIASDLNAGPLRGDRAWYLDLESDRDLAQLTLAESFFDANHDKLVILDEVHRRPGLFSLLRGSIDRARRKGHSNGLYLLLGSASIDLLRQTGESLAGRVSNLELTPLGLSEFPDLDRLWLRGGYPGSTLASSDAGSRRWRTDFVRTYEEREIPLFGRRIEPQLLRRFWQMLAHLQGTTVNLSQLANSLGLNVKTVTGYVDLLEQMFLVRRLLPWYAKLGKRLVKSPKYFIRDSGILHTLLGIEDYAALLAHPAVGQSWEGFVIENLLRVVPEGVNAWFYRTAVGAELDLVLAWPNGEKWAIEVKRSSNPVPSKGFYFACDDLAVSKRLIVFPGEHSHRVAAHTEAVPLATALELIGS